ncbi:MAG: hypothetical protein Q8942_19240 [Bacillota bacterium]|nr:hypothetical protein [Bacillota bacterium]
MNSDEYCDEIKFDEESQYKLGDTVYIVKHNYLDEKKLIEMLSDLIIRKEIMEKANEFK